MLIKVQRETYTSQSTQGEMFLDGVHECWTLEPRADQSQGKPYCIPAAIYDYVVGLSEHFDRNVIKILNVPGFTSIEVHPGNYPSNTLGCTVVGTTRATDFVGHSQDEYNALMSKIPPVGQIQYLDAPGPENAT